MNETPESPPPLPPAPRKGAFPWSVALICGLVLLLGGMALIAYLVPVIGVRKVAEKGVDAGLFIVTNVPTIAARFKSGTITHTFRESIPSVRSSGGDILELASAENDETFSIADEKRVGWDLVYLGTSQAEIRVPVTFRYHLRLSDAWRLETRDHVCIVLAPRIRATRPPAIHMDRMEKRAASGWARFDKAELLEELEKSMMGSLQLRATDEAHMALAREACRQSVAAFVRTWLLREDQWRKDRFTAIVVVFPDEIEPGTENDLGRYETRPALRLQD